MDLACSFPLVVAGLAQPRAHCGSPAAREGREGMRVQAWASKREAQLQETAGQAPVNVH